MPTLRMTLLAATSATAMAGIAVLAVAPSASASRVTHKIHVNSKSVSSYKFDRRHFLADSNLRARHLGKAGDRIGSATYSCRGVSRDGATIHCFATMTFQGGQLLGTTDVDFATNKVTGTITTGSGDYAGATGTIKGIGTSRSHAIITITYTS